MTSSGTYSERFDNYTFSNLSLMGAGFMAVMVAAISFPSAKASSLVLPDR
jgi:hypothetical protein